jgi:cystathionine gamma-synthase
MLNALEKSRRLLTAPLWREQDLGRRIPDTPHATSVALPLWKHVVGYEEGDPAVTSRMACGYPRFVFHPLVGELFQACETRFAREGECAFVFPSATVAARCQRFLKAKAGSPSRLEAVDGHRLTAVLLPRAHFEVAKKFWQHFGEIVSSRQAQAVLHGRTPTLSSAKEVLRARIGGYLGEPAQHVFLYPTGIAALAEAHRMVQALAPGHKSVQVGFPYVDVLKIQTETDPGVHFFPGADAKKVDEVEHLLAREPVSGVICEFAGNPLLTSVDVVRLAKMLRERGVPLIVDETLGTFVNLDLMPHADAVVTSLTKYFAGTGDVMAGSLVLNRRSPFYDNFKAYLEGHHEDLLWDEDAQALEVYSVDFADRVGLINQHAEELCDWLHGHPLVERLYYPKYTTPEHYRQVHTPVGGFGGLFSLVLKDAARNAPRFYDRLRVSKGPSLGTNFTLACPYTLLAHYHELDEVEEHGVSRWLVRVSVGLEAGDDLIERFKEAFARL